MDDHAPFIESAAIESAATARRDDAKIFLREFTRELVREIRPTTKIIALLIVLAIVGGFLYLGFGLYNELKRNRGIAEELAKRQGQLGDQISKTNSELGNIGKSNQNILDSLSLAPKLRNDYGGGVCMILGTYYFVEPGKAGRPLRYPEPRTNDDAVFGSTLSWPMPGSCAAKIDFRTFDFRPSRNAEQPIFRDGIGV